MSTTAHDEKIRHELAHELQCITSIEPGSVGVAVEAGVVTLTGHVDDPRCRQTAENLAARLPGVLAVTNAIEVRHRSRDVKDEASLARAVVDAFGRPAHRES